MFHHVFLLIRCARRGSVSIVSDSRRGRMGERCRLLFCGVHAGAWCGSSSQARQNCLLEPARRHVGPPAPEDPKALPSAWINSQSVMTILLRDHSCMTRGSSRGSQFLLAGACRRGCDL